jgi:Asp-tRNA(Asn)/Glu-tRNA(Gln) amidotransferase A subunit family amidase
MDARGKVGDFETSRALAWERQHFEERIGGREKLRNADAVTLDEYLAAQKVLAECRKLIEIPFGDFDVLLGPSAPGEAPKGLATTGDAIFNQTWTALHTPCVTVPVAKGPAGLPIGAQLVGAFGADLKTLACAEWMRRSIA